MNAVRRIIKPKLGQKQYGFVQEILLLTCHGCCHFGTEFTQIIVNLMVPLQYPLKNVLLNWLLYSLNSTINALQRLVILIVGNPLL